MRPIIGCYWVAQGWPGKGVIDAGAVPRSAQSSRPGTFRVAASVVGDPRSPLLW
jgi:hypothetical protein